MALSDFTPEPADVAAYMRQRITDKFGGEITEFSEETNPTLTEIEDLIPKGVKRVAAKIGKEICEGGDPEQQQELYGDASDLAALATAIIAERSYWPQQIGTDRSPYDAMVEEFKDSSKTLIEAISEHCGGGGGDSVGGPGPLPASSFPPPSGIGEVCW